MYCKRSNAKKITGMQKFEVTIFFIFILAALEEKNGDLAKVEVDKMAGLVCDVGAEVSADDAMPGGVILLIEFFLDVGGDVFFDVELLQGYVGAINCVLLHFFVHIGMLDDCFSFS